MVGGDRETINHDNRIWETSTCEYLSVYLQIKTVGIPGYYQLQEPCEGNMIAKLHF